jgi:hypothetical protein
MKPHISIFHLPTVLAVICLLASVLCQPSRAAGSWLVDGQAVQSLEVQTTNDDPAALHTDGTRSMQAPLIFAEETLSPGTGLISAWSPWEDEYDLFGFDDGNETFVLCPTYSSLGFEAANFIFNGNGSIDFAGGSAHISFEEYTFGGGGWYMSAVANDPTAVLNRSYADSRYIQRTEGIAVNHTIQAGDVLQIENGIITAINP